MAATLGIIDKHTTFQAFDGTHQAELLPTGDIRLHMNDVHQVNQLGEDVTLNTGSPHLIRFVNRVYDYPVYAEGKRLRESEPFRPAGTNVNFVELQENNAIFVRTYERGVENETLSCGTGVTAAALAAAQKGYTSPVVVHTLGGDLAVEFQAGDTFTGISLIGPAKKVFEGVLEL
jgi:diaminopimelate epimerase